MTKVVDNTVDYLPLTPKHFSQVVALGNQVHGENYLSSDSLNKMYERSWQNGINASWVALLKQKVIGFRITYATSQWSLDQWCSPDDWGMPKDKVCYFKCNTVVPECQGLGVGSAMLARSITSAKQQGAQAGLAHIWLASPGNSAFKYFSKNGGKLIKQHPNKWRYSSVYEGYECPVCANYCECTAAEMLLNFSHG